MYSSPSDVVAMVEATMASAATRTSVNLMVAYRATDAEEGTWKMRARGGGRNVSDASAIEGRGTKFGAGALD
jgi:hypothetical protein